MQRRIDVSLIPSGSKLGKGIEDQLGAAGDRAGAKGGKSFLARIGSVIKKGALAVGVAAGGLLATALVKGWGRLTNIENATAKLTGLGNSASAVKGIMDNALASVKGTAFGLDEAATTAAGVVAAGIKPGKELQGVLQTVADTATIAGKSMADTGAIFGSVAARGKLQGDDLLQLQSAGVPVLAMLAKHYGITAAAASQMVTKGQVDFKNFNAALHENLGGAALKSGETTQGAFKNMGAAISRFGAMLLSGVFPAAKTVFGYINTWTDNLNARLAPLVEAASKRIAAAFQSLPAVWATVADKWNGFFGAGSGSIFDTFRSGITMNAADRKEFADSLADDKWMRYGANVRTGLDNAVAAARASVPKMKEAAGEFWSALTTGAGGDSFAARIGETLRSAGQNAKAMILPAFSGTIDRLQSIWGKLADTGKRALKPLMEIIGALATAFGDAFQTISGTGLSVWGLLLKAADGLASMLQTYLVPALQGLAKWLKENRTIVGAAITALVAYKTASFAIAVAQKAWAVATGIVTAAQKLLNGAMKANPIGIVITLVAALAAGFIYLWTHSEGFRNFWIGLWNGIKSVVSNTVSAVVAAFDGVQAAIAGMINSVLSVVQGTWNFIYDYIVTPVKTAWDFVHNLFDTVVTWIGQTAQRIANRFMADWQLFYDYVLSPVIRAWDWVADKFAAVAGWIAGVATAIAKPFKAAWDVFYDYVIGPVKTAWDWVAARFAEANEATFRAVGVIVGGVKSAWGFVYDYIVTPLQRAWDWVAGKFVVIGGVFAGIWDGITAAAKVAWGLVHDYIISPLSSAYQWIQTQFGKIAGWFERLWTGIKDKATSIIGAIGDAISVVWDGVTATIKGLINGAISLVNGAVWALNKVITGINAASSLLGIPAIPYIPEVPKLATGGMTTGPLLAMLGDNKSGNELVLPMDSPRTVSALSSALKDAMRQTSNNRSATTPQPASDSSNVVAELQQMRGEFAELTLAYKRLPNKLMEAARNSGVPVLAMGHA